MHNVAFTIGLTMMDDLQNLFAQLCELRNFNPKDALEQKKHRINTYFAQCGLNAAIVGVSGGVDSALSLNLLCHAMREPNSPIECIVGAVVPIYGRGTTAQDEATAKGRAVVEQAGANLWTLDASNAFEAIVAQNQMLPNAPVSTPWAEGQLASYLRTPVLYYGAALLQEQGYRSLVVGTTNRDEGAYLGFFGKASDAMVDVQPISDLHKHEVYQLARMLNVPQDVLDAPPSGDVFDGQLDEQMIGAPYWFVSLYMMWLAHPEREQLYSNLHQHARERFDTLAAHLEALHQKNAHKYTVGSPSIHLDVYPRAVPGGWS